MFKRDFLSSLNKDFPMRIALILTGLLIGAMAPAAANPVIVSEGLWRVTTDVYTEVAVDGVPQGFDPEFSQLEECWEGESMTSIDESMLTLLGDDCEVLDSRTTDYAISGNLACTIEGFDARGSSRFAKSSDGNSFALLVGLSLDEPGLNVEVQAVMMGSNLGACPAP